MMAAGFLVRLAFMGNTGFQNDVSSFEAWSLSLVTHPIREFYSSTGFADYPPGYFYILWVVGHLYALLAPHGNIGVLKYLVKLPAVLADLADAALLFAIVRRYADERWALGVAALFIFNPATIFISASWGQVDSISAGLALLAVWLLLRSENGMWRFVAAWLALASSLLIKPQAAILVPLFVAFAFVDPGCRRNRSIATAAGILAAFAFAFVLVVPFHPTANPLAAFQWLYHQYSFGKDVYPFNTVNAFNLWAVMHPFWTSDAERLGIWPQYVWALLLVGGASALTIVRYVQTPSERTFFESAAVLTLAFFILSTRMHERYVYDGLLMTMACIPFARRYLWAAIVFSATLFLNLVYSLQYLNVMLNHLPANSQDLWGWPDHALSLVNVGAFFVLGYLFLGQSEEEAAAPARPVAAATPARVLRARAWFNPREGLGSMLWPLDYVLAAALAAVSFVVSYVNYWYPPGKIFDEIYFARAAEEYLKGLYIYENTHPPLTKLIITLSVMLFGGLHGGDNSHGWRFMDVLFGAIVVAVIYAFAKRLTRSTLFAAFASVLLIADGMHFVQSRIATPEGIVVVFSLGTLYAFYRYWIASQSVVRRYEPEPLRRMLVCAAGALVLGAACGGLTNHFGNPPHQAGRAGFIVATLYFALGWYLTLRLWIIPRFVFPAQGEFATFAEGSMVVPSAAGPQLISSTGAVIKKNATIAQEEAAITYRREGAVEYATPEGSATYTPGRVSDDAGEIEEGRHATGWLVAFTVLLGALVASKWYGVMAYGVSFLVIGFVWLQRAWRAGKPKTWGNPFGFRLDVALGAIVFISMSIYICAWIPDLVRHVPSPGDTGAANVSELVYRQYTMFQYHDTLKATHPYQSSWWQWPLDARPIAYYWHDTRSGALTQSATACCVAEITSLPNPVILWFGLLCVPAVGLLAWRERNKGYALLLAAYVLQWLPWAESPRITFAYHFYVDIPIIILCIVIVLQRLWNAVPDAGEARIFARLAVCGYVAVAVLAFVWFYPILAAVPLRWDQWHARMLPALLGNGWV